MKQLMRIKLVKVRPESFGKIKLKILLPRLMHLTLNLVHGFYLKMREWVEIQKQKKNILYHLEYLYI